MSPLAARESLVRVRQATKRYRRERDLVEVLHGVDLEVMSGEFVALMGPSGSGKSTLLNLIGGLDRPDEGEILVAGEPVHQLSEGQLSRWRARHVGFVCQFYNLMPTLSAEQNVELPLLLTRLSRRERRDAAAAALELVRLHNRRRHKPTQLSGGEQQRVAIARAIVTDPTLLVCDEPTGDLDRDTSDEILALLQVLSARHGKSIIMVTHDPLAAAYADRTVRLDKGAIVPAGAAT